MSATCPCGLLERECPGEDGRPPCIAEQPADERTLPERLADEAHEQAAAAAERALRARRPRRLVVRATL